jgi:hypothetical protein|tara:strand:- start:270 stop:494 length:225 start_codon:yes stop_codon:yes gene_type:complete
VSIIHFNPLTPEFVNCDKDQSIQQQGDWLINESGRDSAQIKGLMRTTTSKRVVAKDGCHVGMGISRPFCAAPMT